MTDLTTRITERLDQLEAIARNTTHRRWVEGSLWFEGMTAPDKLRPNEPVPAEDTRHMATWDPNAALALIAGIREIPELHAVYNAGGPPTLRCRECGDISEAPEPWPCATVLAIAKALRIEVP